MYYLSKFAKTGRTVDISRHDQGTLKDSSFQKTGLGVPP